MAKKRLFKDAPTTDKRGHFFYYDDNLNQLSQSNSLPPNLDKFNSSALYTSVQESLINKTILKYGLGKETDSQITINTLEIGNNGVSLDIAKTRLDVWLFDDISWLTYRNEINVDSTLPETMNEYELYKALYKANGGRLGEFGKWMSDTAKTEDPNLGAVSARIFRYRPGDIGKGKGMGDVIKDDVVLEALKDSVPGEVDLNSSQAEPFSAKYAFGADDNYNSPILQWGGQFIYFIIRTSGDGKRSIIKDKKRKKSYTIYKIPSENFFNNQTPKEETFKLSPTKIINGGGKYRTAFKVNEFEIFVDTRASETQTYPEEELPNGLIWGDEPETEDVIPSYSFNEVTQSRAAVKEPVLMNLRNLFQEFRTQAPNKEIRGHKFIDENDNDSFSGAIQKNFEPMAKVNVVGHPEYDLSAYQEDEVARQICSAPNQIELGFDISEYIGNGNLIPTDGYGIGKWEGYKFYVVDWNDENNKFDNPEKYLNDIPLNDTDMLEKQNQNLYKFADLFETLVHNYSTPGMKIIKAVLFSHLPGYENSQVVRWKFIETRIFLDIPITKFPDFGELGGQDFTTIPWPYTTPIINGISEDSKYKTSIQNTLSGGKLGSNEIIDIRFLEEANENDELGKSIKKMDLEQVRYFNTGSLDMTQLLQIPIVNTETEMIEVQVGETFSDTESWSGPKYIAWNEGTTACRTTRENGADGDLNNNGYNYDYLCASEYPEVPFWTTGGNDNASSATDCCNRKFDNPAPFRWVAETCGNNGIIPDSDYKAYECRLAEFAFEEVVISSEFNPYTDTNYWDCRDWNSGRNYCFSEESSVGQIFIDDNSDLDLKQNCKLELNLGEMDGKTLSDTNGNPNKGLLIGDYKVKKRQKNIRMKRDSFIKLPKKGTSDGAL